VTACLKALSFAATQGMLHLVLETNCKIQRDALFSYGWDAGHDGILLREIKFLIVSSFNVVKVMCAPRSCNNVAHKLADNGVVTVHGSPSVWVTSLPNFVTDLVTSELMLSEG
jgi:hypothetical protein